jgi:hypothetical protein
VRRLDYSADGVRRSLESSLQRLGLDRVDIVLVHDPDDHIPQALAEALPALVALRDEGVIGAVGIGMNQWQAPLRFVQESDVDVVMVAGRWTLVDRSAEPLLDACAERGVSVLAAAPYNSGLLAADEPDGSGSFDYGRFPRLVLERARQPARVSPGSTARPCRRLPAVPLRHPAVAGVVTGLRSVEQRARRGWAGWPSPLPDELVGVPAGDLGAGECWSADAFRAGVGRARGARQRGPVRCRVTAGMPRHGGQGDRGTGAAAVRAPGRSRPAGSRVCQHQRRLEGGEGTADALAGAGPEREVGPRGRTGPPFSQRSGSKPSGLSRTRGGGA